jgi:glycine/D-amino acid oxidase-like deaminating enzyme
VAARETAEVVIIGAGLAGAATAFHLARDGVRDVVVVEREECPGLHASGRNAAMVRRIVTRADLLTPVVEGARFLETEARELPTAPGYAASGAMILATGPAARQLRRGVRTYRRAGIEAEWVDAQEVERRVPVTIGGSFEGGVRCASDGIVDVAALLEGYLRAAVRAGVRLRLAARAEVRRDAARRRWIVAAGSGLVATPTVVNAAGRGRARSRGRPAPPTFPCGRSDAT